MSPGSVHTETFTAAGTEFGGTFETINGALPNEHGTWQYGRDGWQDGSAVRPWLVDITSDIFGAGGQPANTTISYRGTFQGKDPNPPPQENPPYMVVHMYLSWY